MNVYVLSNADDQGRTIRNIGAEIAESAGEAPMTSERTLDRADRRDRRIGPARQLYLQMMDGIVAPHLAALGFRPAGRDFQHQRGDYLATIQLHTMNRNWPGQFHFEVRLGVSCQPEGPHWFWHEGLAHLDPGPNENPLPGPTGEAGRRWTLYVGQPADPVAANLLAAIVGYGLPAVEAVLADPGYPEQPDRRWPRTFQPVHGRAAWAAVRADLEAAMQMAQPPQPAGLAGHESVYADLAHADGLRRLAALNDLRRLGLLAQRRSHAGLLNRLAADPEQRVRREAALCLAGLAADPAIQDALTAAAAEDEDRDVRWAARFALRQLPSAGREEYLSRPA
jgi:hypothetical protein